MELISKLVEQACIQTLHLQALKQSNVPLLITAFHDSDCCIYKHWNVPFSITDILAKKMILLHFGGKNTPVLPAIFQFKTDKIKNCYNLQSFPTKKVWLKA